jgi:hypothetical protein
MRLVDVFVSIHDPVRRPRYGMVCVFSATLRSRRSGLILGRGGATSSRCELPINFLNREGPGIVIAADPVAHFLMLFMVGISEGVEEFIMQGGG